QRPRRATPASAPATPHRKGETHRLGIPHYGFAGLPRHVVARNDSLGGRIASGIPHHASDWIATSVLFETFLAMTTLGDTPEMPG
ncbi:MAG: hypothetical protein H8E24_06830, partial [Verrucomicrobia bacterium]|nr:hypothetical protein [Verrucomicrobiota bacterium]